MITPVYVYALVSEKTKEIYVGITIHLEQRVKEHNAGKSKFTKGRVPWKLAYSEVCNSRIEARKREIYLKSGIGKEFLKEIIFKS
jgi:putative endonuclease